jgi:hypothetical protein
MYPLTLRRHSRDDQLLAVLFVARPHSGYGSTLGMDGEDQGILPPAGDHITPRCQREHGLLP